MSDYQPVTFDVPQESAAALRDLLKSRFRLVALVASGASLTFQTNNWEGVDKSALGEALRAAGFSGSYEVGEAYASRFCSP
jgi:hypothetical protein